MKKLTTPLLAYYGVALAIPMINGSGSTDAHFLEHASFVLLGPLAMVCILEAVQYGWRRLKVTASAKEIAARRSNESIV